MALRITGIMTKHDVKDATSFGSLVITDKLCASRTLVLVAGHESFQHAGMRFKSSSVASWQRRVSAAGRLPVTKEREILKTIIDKFDSSYCIDIEGH